MIDTMGENVLREEVQIIIEVAKKEMLSDTFEGGKQKVCVERCIVMEGTSPT